MWFEMVYHIPDEAFIAIINDVIEGEKFFPTPGILKKKWFEWMAINPDKIVRNKESCDECHGTGGIDYFIPNEEAVPYVYRVACASCENWKLAFPTKGTDAPHRMTRKELLDMGGSFALGDFDVGHFHKDWGQVLNEEEEYENSMDRY